MPKIVQFNNEIKVCRECNNELVIKQNWTVNNVLQYNYICKICQNKQNQERRAKKRKPKIITKFCKDCNIELIKEENWLSHCVKKRFYVCSSCLKVRNAKNHLNNLEEKKIKAKIYRDKNREKIREFFRKRYKEKKDEIKASRKEAKKNTTPEKKEKQAKRKREYSKNNRKKLNAKSKISRQKRIENDPSIKLKGAVSAQIRIALASNNSSKNGKSCWENLSYTPKELRIYIENLFSHPDNLTINGEVWMSWKNYGLYKVDDWDDNNPNTWKWQLDHIIPHSNFKYTDMTCDQFKECWALENLRPLSAKVNVYENKYRSLEKINEIKLSIIKFKENKNVERTSAGS